MQEVVHDAERLKELQALPLERKIQISQARIIEWYQHWKGQVCVSFSGGKDSTVLFHLVHQLYPDVKAVFVNTGLEYPEIQKFARQKGADIVTPSLRFNEVITTYGYPLIGKEVAEAIYYARRIRSQDVHVERERELRSGSEESYRAEGSRTEKVGTYLQTDWKQRELMGGYCTICRERSKERFLQRRTTAFNRKIISSRRVLQGIGERYFKEDGAMVRIRNRRKNKVEDSRIRKKNRGRDSTTDD